MGYPAPSQELTKALVGAQLHHMKLSQDLRDMIELCVEKVRAHQAEDSPDVAEISKTQKIMHTCQLELDKRRFSGLENK